MASQKEFRKVNEIINTVKRADGQNAHLYDVLDVCHISLSWWKDHKEWIFHRFPQITLQEIEGDKMIIYNEPINNK